MVISEIHQDILLKPVTEKIAAKAAESVGDRYPLLMIELGVSVQDISNERANNANNMRGAVFNLLLLWKQQNKDDCTLQRLLSTMDFVGISSVPLQKRLKEEFT